MPEEINREAQYTISALVSLAEASNRVLKHGDTFLVTDRHGDIRPLGFEEHGLFHKETRFLSRYVLRLEEKSLALLSSAGKEENDLISVDLTNPDFFSPDGALIRTGTVHLKRSFFLWEGCLYGHLKIMNYRLLPLEFSLDIEFDADFADLFEVRGTRRPKRGEFLPPALKDGVAILSYRGLDGMLRRTRVELSPLPLDLTPSRARFFIHLGSHQAADVYLTAACELESEPAHPKVFDQALAETQRWQQKLREGACRLVTSSERFNQVLGRARADLNMLTTETRHGLYPYAGIPWFSTVFGRDGILTALEILWISPEWARGVLDYLAAVQAGEVIPEEDAEPGKILHERRQGEMARTREIPFGSYYGTVDATPLFIVLAGYYYERTADLDFIARIWPNIERALKWIEVYGDQDGDGFVEYLRRSSDGLINQGWKDSVESIFHADGLLASPPISLCEVQGYVYEAKMKAGRLASALGKNEIAATLLAQAQRLRENFLRVFWCEDLGTYALALDAEKRPCRVRTSNAGHCLFSGIASEEHARILARTLMGASSFSGWGIRTLDSSDVRYNPMSYHNGSVWPHDNALAAFGFGRYGFKEEAVKLLTGFFEASLFFDLYRPPELFCGFDRARGEGPTLYPVACNPQAWASGAVFLLLQACLGLAIHAPEGKVLFNHPTLPPFLRQLRIENLKVGLASLDLELTRVEGAVGIHVLRREGTVEIITTK